MQARTRSHPRIHLTAATLAKLRKSAHGTHAFFYAKLIEAADEFIARGKPDIKPTGDDNRGYGDILPVISMAYLLTGHEKYLETARSVTRQLVAFEHWGDDLDLVTGHFLGGVAIVYDWLYEELTPRERKLTRAKIARQAAILDEYSRQQRIWWHHYFLHNWAHVITGSLAYAAAALWGEDKRAASWIEQADAFFTDVEARSRRTAVTRKAWPT